MNKQIVVVLGASAKPQRFSNKAIIKLKQHGHQVIPIHPKSAEIEQLPVLADLEMVSHEVDTLTLYVGPQRSAELIDDIVKLKPKRVILNPGTESKLLEQKLEEFGISIIKDCTLVMLDAGRF